MTGNNGGGAAASPCPDDMNLAEPAASPPSPRSSRFRLLPKRTRRLWWRSAICRSPKRRNGPGVLLADDGLPTEANGLVPELMALLALATRVINDHVDDGGLCAVCGSAFPCERAVLAEHNLALF